MLKNVLLIAALWLPIFAFAEGPEVFTFESAGLTDLIVQNRAGDVRVSSAEGPKATVTATKKAFSETCELIVERKETKLAVIVKQKGFVDTSGDCEVQFDIQVPKAVNLDLAMGAGNTEINGLEGQLQYKVGSGGVRGKGRFSNVHGKSGSGSVKLEGLTGNGVFSGGSGSVDLTYAQAPAKGELAIHIGSGSAAVAFPKGSKVKADLKSGVGKIKNELGSSKDPAFRVSMKSGVGNLRLSAY